MPDASTRPTTDVRIAIAPEPVPAYAVEAVEEAGATIAPLADAEALVWTSPAGPDELAATLEQAPNARWVHLRWAGVEDFARLGLFDPARTARTARTASTGLTWTCGKGVFAEPVAEHALALALAGLRQLPERVRATSWQPQGGQSLYDGRVTILGAGGIAEKLIELLRPMRTHVTVVRRQDAPMPGADRTFTVDRITDAVHEAQVVFVALALTPGTDGIVDARVLEAMHPEAWLVNVGRGRHVVTDGLVEALSNNTIAGAALDVTEPEPLPDGHPLWTLPNTLITPHTANTFEMAVGAMKQRIVENVRRFAAGEPLVGTVDPRLGY